MPAQAGVQLVYRTDRCHQLKILGRSKHRVHFETPEVAAYT